MEKPVTTENTFLTIFYEKHVFANHYAIGCISLNLVHYKYAKFQY